MTLIDGDKIVTAQLYDDQYEEFTEKKMSIIDYVNAYTDEGVTTADNILGRIRDEINEVYNDRPYSYNHSQRTELFCKVMKIIDKYRESESKV